MLESYSKWRLTQGNAVQPASQRRKNVSPSGDHFSLDQQAEGAGSWQVICSASDTFLAGKDKSYWFLPQLPVPALSVDGALPISTSELGRVGS